MLSVEKEGTITIVEQSPGCLQKPLDMVYDKSRGCGTICDRKQGAFPEDLKVLSAFDVSLGMFNYFGEPVKNGEKSNSVLVQQNQSYTIWPLCDVMRDIFNYVHDVLEKAGISPTQFIIPLPYCTSTQLIEDLKTGWRNSKRKEAMLNFVNLEVSVADGLMKYQQDKKPIILVEFNFSTSSIFYLTHEENGYTIKRVVELQLSICDCYNDIVRYLEKRFGITFQLNRKNLLILYHICHNINTTLKTYSQVNVNLSEFEPNKGGFVFKTEIESLFNNKVKELCDCISSFISPYQGYEAFTCGLGFSALPYFTRSLPQTVEWSQVAHEDCYGAFSAARNNAKVFIQPSLRNSSVRNLVCDNLIFDSAIDGSLRYSNIFC